MVTDLFKTRSIPWTHTSRSRNMDDDNILNDPNSWPAYGKSLSEAIDVGSISKLWMWPYYRHVIFNVNIYPRAEVFRTPKYRWWQYFKWSYYLSSTSYKSTSKLWKISIYQYVRSYGWCQYVKTTDVTVVSTCYAIYTHMSTPNYGRWHYFKRILSLE